MIAFADARVSSLLDTELISVSKTPDLRLSTSIFDMVLLSASIDLFVSVSVVVLPRIVSVVAGRVRVTLPENAEWAGACNLA